MKTVLHRANERGYVNHGWLKSYHSFSFASYYDPAKVHFGTLRVLNDDYIAPGMGFGTHPHDNMEIVTIPLKGTLEHQDSMGHKQTLTAGEVQIMSAGSGLQHSEYNHSKTEPVELLQIWVFPKVRNIKPRYEQKKFQIDNKFKAVVSPEKDTDALWANQDTWFSLSETSEAKEYDYKLNNPANGIYIFVIEGKVTTAGHELERRDALGVSGVAHLHMKASEGSKILVIEVPMN